MLLKLSKLSSEQHEPAIQLIKNNSKLSDQLLDYAFKRLNNGLVILTIDTIAIFSS